MVNSSIFYCIKTPDFTGIVIFLFVYASEIFHAETRVGEAEVNVLKQTICHLIFSHCMELYLLICGTCI